MLVGLPTSIAKAPWLRRAVSGGVALLSALVILPVPVLAGVTFNGSWTAGYFLSATNGNATPPTPTYSDDTSSHPGHDILSVDMGTYTETNPSTDPTKQSFATITLDRSITWSPTGSQSLFSQWNLDAFLNSKAQGIEQITVLKPDRTVFTNLMGTQKYTGTSSTPTEVIRSDLEHLTQSQLPAGSYILEVTVRYQTLPDNRIGGQWRTKSQSHKFDFYAQ
jgi:hypothetical protein